MFIDAKGISRQLRRIGPNGDAARLQPKQKKAPKPVAHGGLHFSRRLKSATARLGTMI
jgi:hypothetical protein